MREWEIGAVENIHGALPYIRFAPILALVSVGVNRIGKEHSPFGIWEEDYSAVKTLIDRLRHKGVRDIRRYLRKHPETLLAAVMAIELIDVNEAGWKIYRAESKEELLRVDADYDAWKDTNWADYYVEEIAGLAAGTGNFTAEFPEQALDGSEIVVRCIMHVLEGHEETWSRVITTIEDVTEHKALEDQLRQAQKMEAVGQLTGGIAHDFNNLLAIVCGNLELIGEEIEDNEHLHRRVGYAIDAANDAATLTRRLLAFSRKQSLDPRATDANELVQNMLSLWARTLGATIDVETRFAIGLPPTLVDPAQFENALLNLALNARDAMPDGGRLTIETAVRTLGADDTDGDAPAPAGQYVMVAVGDSGAGMPAEIVEHVFEPFFTTKDVGKGSGLGLSMVHGFVKQSGGRVRIESEVGVGTTIRIYLPQAGRQAISDATPELQLPRRGGGETILVVEDEARVRQFAVTALTRLGYVVHAASDGQSALALIDEVSGIDFLFTDVILPGGMSGPDLARQARRRRPELKVLYTTGYARDTVLGEDESAVIEKRCVQAGQPGPTRDNGARGGDLTGQKTAIGHRARPAPQDQTWRIPARAALCADAAPVRP